MKLGALDPIEIEYDGTYTARASASFPDVYRISSPYQDGEYLLIENRQGILSDELLWEPGGIVIYHVDENMEGYGNRYRGGPFLEGWPGNGDHYKVAVLQADTKYELEMALNLGHNADFWKVGDSLGPGNGELVATEEGIYPNTDSYVGGNIIVTGLVIDSFEETEPGVWSFRVRNLADPPISDAPTMLPTHSTNSPTILPTATVKNTSSPSEAPSDSPSLKAILSFMPSLAPSTMLTAENDTAMPSESPSSSPSLESILSINPNILPSAIPTIAPFPDSKPPNDESSASSKANSIYRVAELFCFLCYWLY